MDVQACTSSAAALVEQCLDNARKWNPHINVVITLDEDGARRSASEADRLAREGRSAGLLHGVPVLIKDNIDTAGLRTTYASGFFEEHIPEHDAAVVSRLRAAGAVILGKVSLHEFAFGIRSNNPVIGQSRNLWNREHIPGGSSGGSGAAVAAGLAPMALGTDTGGSVRIPAAFNGISGLRPTTGRVPNHGCMPVSPTHDTIGPMARSVNDVARLFAVIAGFDPADPVSANQPLENFLPRLGDPIEGMRIGIPVNNYFEGVDPAVGKAVEEAMRVLEKAGVRFVDVRVPGAEHAHEYATTMIYCDACAVHEERLNVGGPQWHPDTLERMQIGLKYTPAATMRAPCGRARAGNAPCKACSARSTSC